MDRMRQNRSNAAIIDKTGLSHFIKQVLKQDNLVLTLPCFSLVFWKDSEPYRAFH